MSVFQAHKWKQRYEQLLDASMCRNVWAYLNVESGGTVRLVYRHDCGDDCAFIKTVHGE